MKKIILDCDPGVDDALAILLALNSEKIKLIGITTTYGNCSVKQATINTIKLINYFDLKLPIAKGSSEPLKAKKIHAKEIHGNDGMGDVKFLLPVTRKISNNAIKFILHEVEYNNVKTIVATGPLTNIAKCFQENKKIMNSIDELIIMGGAIYEPGNVDRKSEFNFYSDPHAANFVLKQSVKKTLIPLDVTNKVILKRSHLKLLKNNKATRLVKALVKKYQQHYIHNFGFAGNALHDPLALAYVIDKSFVKLESLDVKVENTGIYTRGTCVIEKRPGKYQLHRRLNVNVALKVNKNKFLNYFLKSLSNFLIK